MDSLGTGEHTAMMYKTGCRKPWKSQLRPEHAIKIQSQHGTCSSEPWSGQLSANSSSLNWTDCTRCIKLISRIYYYTAIHRQITGVFFNGRPQ